MHPPKICTFTYLLSFSLRILFCVSFLVILLLSFCLRLLHKICFDIVTYTLYFCYSIIFSSPTLYKLFGIFNCPGSFVSYYSPKKLCFFFFVACYLCSCFVSFYICTFHIIIFLIVCFFSTNVNIYFIYTNNIERNLNYFFCLFVYVYKSMDTLSVFLP